jgi:hypothetical protein
MGETGITKAYEDSEYRSLEEKNKSLEERNMTLWKQTGEQMYEINELKIVNRAL